MAGIFLQEITCVLYDSIMNKKYIIYLLLVIAIVYLGWEFFRPRPGVMQSQTSTASSITASALDSVVDNANTGALAVQEKRPASVLYSGSGFAPQNITVKKGTAVMWTNISPDGMWIASSEHPAHAGHDDTDAKAHCAEGAPASFDQCKASAAGSQWSFTFNTVGVWKYHSETHPEFTGTITVTE